MPDNIRILKPEGVALLQGGVPLAWVCLLCKRISYNQNDALNQYCGCCGARDLPKTCEHRQSVKPKR
jgi:hypothetical protein